MPLSKVFYKLKPMKRLRLIKMAHEALGHLLSYGGKPQVQVSGD